MSRLGRGERMAMKIKRQAKLEVINHNLSQPKETTPSLRNSHDSLGAHPRFSEPRGSITKGGSVAGKIVRGKVQPMRHTKARFSKDGL